jgi:WD40 repeat protein
MRRICEKIGNHALDTRQNNIPALVMANTSAHTAHASAIAAHPPTTDAPITDAANQPTSTVSSHSAEEVPSSSNMPPSKPQMKRVITRAYEVRIAERKKASPVECQDIQSWENAFQDTPRQILSFRPTNAPDLRLLVGSSLDGAVRFWKDDDPNPIYTIEKTKLVKPWIEDMCLVSNSILAMAAPVRIPSVNNQISLIHFDMHQERGPSARIQHLSDQPHTHGIHALELITSTNTDFTMASAGNDRSIILWKLKHPYYKNDLAHFHSTRALHTLHTADIYALAYERMSSSLYSGGADRQLIIWDIAKESCLHQQDMSDIVSKQL